MGWHDRAKNWCELGSKYRDRFDIFSACPELYDDNFIEFMFLGLRHQYYGVMRRLNVVQKLLGLSDPKNWGGEECPISPKLLLGVIDDVESWRVKTKPGSSFLTRSIYLAGANQAVIMFAWHGYKIIGREKPWESLALWTLANLSIFGLAVLRDYLHFTRNINRKKSDVGENPSTP